MEKKKVFQQISQDLRAQQKLEFINFREEQLDLENIFHVKDTNNEFSLKIISLISDGKDDINKDKLNEAKGYATRLKNCNHPNIIKYINEFQIGNNYFILMEKSSVSLHDYVNNQKKQKINVQEFRNKAIQLLEGAYYLHTQDLVLRNFSINNVMVDNLGSIKITSIGIHTEVDYQFMKQTFETSLEKNELFYYPPELLDIQNFDQKNAMLSYDEDIWQVGICLYFMAGSSKTHIRDYIQHKEPYIVSKRLGVDINMILINVLQINPNKTRPSIPYLIQSFKNINKNDETNTLQNQISASKDDQNDEEISEFSIENQELINNLMNGIDSFNSYEYDKSISYFEQCLKMNNMIDISLYFIAKAYDCLGSLDQSINYYKNSIQLNSMNDSAYNNLGLIYSQQNNEEQAIIYFNKSLEINQKNDFSLYNLGNIHRLGQRFDESLNYYNQVIQIKPLDSDSYLCLGLLYQDQNKYDSAIDYFKKAIKIDPKQNPQQIILANLYYRQEQYDEAIFYYNMANECEPSNEAYHNLGLTYSKKNQLNKSIIHFKKSLVLDPIDGSSHYYLALDLQRKKMYEKAFKHIQKANQYFEELENNLDKTNLIKSQL